VLLSRGGLKFDVCRHVTDVLTATDDLLEEELGASILQIWFVCLGGHTKCH
jgi:hypothetical protein